MIRVYRQLTSQALLFSARGRFIRSTELHHRLEVDIGHPLDGNLEAAILVV